MCKRLWRQARRSQGGAEECDDRSLVNPDTAIGLAGHISDVGQAAFFALARCGRASATADRLRAAPRHLREPGLCERVAFTMWGIRPIFFPPLPVLSQSHELFENHAGLRAKRRGSALHVMLLFENLIRVLLIFNGPLLPASITCISLPKEVLLYRVPPWPQPQAV